jgi:hypothetical protein
VNAQHQLASNERQRSRDGSLRIGIEAVKGADPFTSATKVVTIGIDTFEIIERSDLLAGRAQPLPS